MANGFEVRIVASETEVITAEDPQELLLMYAPALSDLVDKLAH